LYPPSYVQGGTKVEEYFRTEYFKLADTCIQQLSDRLIDCPGLKVYCELENVLLTGHVGPIVEQYPELHSRALQTELTMFRTLESQASLRVCLVTFRNLSADMKALFPNVETLLRLLAVNPASSATAERSFSSLRRLKTFLRSTIGQSRLTHCALCNVHKNILDTVDTVGLMRDFIASKANRSQVFGNVA